MFAVGPEALRTGEERCPLKGEEEANGSGAESVRSRHLLDAVAWRALSHLLQPVPRKDASGSFGSWRAGVLHVKYLNKWICQTCPLLPGLNAQGEETQESCVSLCHNNSSSLFRPTISLIHNSGLRKLRLF